MQSPVISLVVAFKPPQVQAVAAMMCQIGLFFQLCSLEPKSIFLAIAMPSPCLMETVLMASAMSRMMMTLWYWAHHFLSITISQSIQLTIKLECKAT